MTIPIVLFGKIASGKTTLANAFAQQYCTNRVLKIPANILIDRINIDFVCKYELVIVDDIRPSRICDIDKKISNIRQHRKTQIIYLTQSETVSLPSSFLAIECCYTPSKRQPTEQEQQAFTRKLQALTSKMKTNEI